MTSSALILGSQSTQPHQETSLYLRRGPGLTVYQLAEYGGKYIGLGLNAMYRGPKGPKDKIDKFTKLEKEFWMSCTNQIGTI